MSTAAIVFLVVAILIALPIAFRIRKAARRKHWIDAPILPEWQKVAEKYFPRLEGIPKGTRKKIRGIARVLAEEKNFEACGGLEEVTEEMKALICFQAALLIAEIPKHKFYPKLRSILVYPGAFRDRGKRRFGLPSEDRGTLLGESWQTGSVILSWENVKAGAKNDDDGMNVVIHEFAHQLDQADGAADGVPILKNREAYRQWAEVFERNYEEFVEDLESRRGPEPLIDPYGATNPAEFFAVASETFFEESEELKKEHPDLYEQLSNFYHVDPASWR